LSVVDKTILIPVLNLVASIAGVAVTTIYVVATWRYVRLFEKETKTRQIVQEEWEMRRFYASRLFAAADGFIDVFFASKRELEVFIGQASGVDQLLNQLQRAAIASASGSGIIAPAVQDRAANLWDAAYVRYNERAKDHNWRAQALIHQITPFLSQEQNMELMHIFQVLARDFNNLEEARAIAKDYERLLPDVSNLVGAIRSLAVSHVDGGRKPPQ